MKIFVRPAAGVNVIDPATGRALPAAGAEVNESKYWSRRIRDGEAVAVAAPGFRPVPKTTDVKPPAAPGKKD